MEQNVKHLKKTCEVVSYQGKTETVWTLRELQEICGHVVIMSAVKNSHMRTKQGNRPVAVVTES